MPPLKNQRQELFCQYIFVADSPAYECAIRAGYSLKAARPVASRMLTFANVRGRINELNERAAKARIMSKQERMERLSEIGRGKVTDFIVEGQIRVDAKSKNVGALESVTKKTRKVAGAIISEEFTEVKLLNPVAAIDKLNEMDHVYADTTVNIDNRKLSLTFQIVSEETKSLLARIGDGERTDVEADQHLQPEQPGIPGQDKTARD
jgi:phage terminase small subunit